MNKLHAAGTRSKLYTTPNVACTIKSTRPGVCHRRVWLGAPGLDNLNVTFAWIDSFGIPTVATAAAANIDDYPAAATTGNTAAGGGYMTDVWVVTPPGLNSIQFGSRAFGNTAVGFYAGRAYRYMTRIIWGGGFQGATINLSTYSLLCNQRVICCRMYATDSYFNGGWALQWNIGAGYVDVPAANCHAVQPYQSSWPN